MTFLEEKEQVNIAKVNKSFRQTLLDLNTRDLVDLLMNYNQVSYEVINKAKQRYQEEKKSSHNSSSSWLANLFFSRKPPSSNLYQHLLTTFKSELINQLSLGYLTPFNKKTFIQSNNSVCNLKLSIENLKRYALHFCNLNRKLAGELTADTIYLDTTHNEQYSIRNENIALALIEYGADIKAANEKKCLVQIAFQNKKFKVVKKLLDSKQIKLSKSEGETLLKQALEYNNFEIADQLLKTNSELKLQKVLAYLSIQGGSEGPVNRRLIHYLFSHSITPLELLSKQVYFPTFLGYISNEGNHKKYLFTLEKYAKNLDHALTPKDVFQCLFPTYAADMLPPLKHTPENYEQLQQFFSNLSFYMRDITREKSEKMMEKTHIIRTFTFLYQIGESEPEKSLAPRLM